MLGQGSCLREVLPTHATLKGSVPGMTLGETHTSDQYCAYKGVCTTIAHLHVPRDLLLARKAIVAMSRAPLPEAVVVRATAPYVRRCDVVCECVARGETLTASRPTADVRRGGGAVMFRDRRRGAAIRS